MYLLAVVSVVVLTIAMGVFPGMDLIKLIDIVSFLFLVLFFIPLMMAGGLLKDFNNAFRLGIGKRKDAGLMELKRAKEAVGLAIRILLAASGFVGVLQGALVLLTLFNTDDQALTASLGVAMIIIVYGIGLALILLPLQARLNIKIQEYISEKG